MDDTTPGMGHTAPNLAPNAGPADLAPITQPSLDALSPIGNGVTTVTYKDGETTIISTKSADMANSGTDLNISASGENLSAKYKNPRVTQDTGTMYSDQK